MLQGIKPVISLQCRFAGRTFNRNNSAFILHGS
jgi:hypothetical protein